MSDATIAPTMISNTTEIIIVDILHTPFILPKSIILNYTRGKSISPFLRQSLVLFVITHYTFVFLGILSFSSALLGLTNI